MSESIATQFKEAALSDPTFAIWFGFAAGVVLTPIQFALHGLIAETAFCVMLTSTVLLLAVLQTARVAWGQQTYDYLQRVKEPYLEGTIDEEELEERLEYKLRQQDDVYYCEEET